jgi:hypothetical protein
MSQGRADDMTTTEERPTTRVKPELRLVRTPLTAAQAIGEVIARDMAGDPDWQLTNSGRQWLATVMQQLAVGEGRGR